MLQMIIKDIMDYIGYWETRWMYCDVEQDDKLKLSGSYILHFVFAEVTPVWKCDTWGQSTPEWGWGLDGRGLLTPWILPMLVLNSLEHPDEYHVFLHS